MMRTPALRRAAPGVMTSATHTSKAPIRGWNTRDSIADMKAGDAVWMENWWPDASDVSLRKGAVNHLTGIGAKVETLLGYSGATSEKLFAATDSGIFDATTPGAAGSALLAITSGQLLHKNFSVLGGTYLIAVNGTDKLMQFDGTSWQFIDGVTSPSITGLATTELAHVEVFKERLWFVEKDSMSAWYLPTKQVGGALTEFPLGQLFSRGGYLAAMGTWTIDSGTGVDDYAIFVTSEGEVGVYQGTDPASASTFQLVGVYYIAPPIGRKCFTKYGGDMLLLTTAGLFPLSKALMSSGLERSLAISDRIAPTFRKSAEVYGVNSGWEALVIPFENMVLVNVPTVEGYSSNQLVMNTITQSWALFTGWNAFCWEVWQGQVFFGGDGIVAKALYGNEDFSANITGKVRTAFDYFGSQKIKHIKMFRPVLSADGNFSADFGIDVDFEDIDRTTTLAVASAATFEWDSALWDSALWAGDQSVQRQWRTVAAKEGFCLSLRLRVAAKGVIVRWNSTDFLYQRGGVL